MKIVHNTGSFKLKGHTLGFHRKTIKTSLAALGCDSLAVIGLETKCIILKEFLI